MMKREITSKKGLQSSKMLDVEVGGEIKKERTSRGLDLPKTRSIENLEDKLEQDK
tara:strand:+ start:970 stop:1134 length:165 start_codon:yes stop_codon:yes gene_type:complete